MGEKRMSNVDFIKILKGYGASPSKEVIKFTSQHLGVNFPSSFLRCIEVCDEGFDAIVCIQFCDQNTKSLREEELGRFLSFNPERSNNILKKFFIPSADFPKDLLAFATTGGGDLICFDYSVSGWEDPDPPVVYWDFYAEDPKNAVSDIAINFEEFLKKLKPCPEDEEE